MATRRAALRRTPSVLKFIKGGRFEFSDFGSQNGLPAYDSRFEYSEPHSTMWVRGRPRYWYHYLESLAEMPAHLSAPPRTPRGLQRVAWLKAFRSPMDPQTHEIFRETDTRTSSVWEWAEQAQKYLDLLSVHNETPTFQLPHPAGVRVLTKEKRAPPRGFSGRPAPLHKAPETGDFDPSTHETEQEVMDRMQIEDFPDVGDNATHTRIHPTSSSTIRKWAPRVQLPSSDPAKNPFLLWVKRCMADGLYTPPTTPPVEWTREEHEAASIQMTKCMSEYLASFYYVHGNSTLWHPAMKVLSPGEVWQLERAARRVQEQYTSRRPAQIRKMVADDADIRARLQRGTPLPRGMESPTLRAFAHDPSEVWDFADVWACLNDTRLYGPREWFLIHYWMDRYWPLAKHFAPTVLKYAGRKDVRDALTQMPLMPPWMQETMFDVYEGRLGPDRFDWVEMFQLNAADPLRFTPSRLATMYKCTVEEARQCMMLGDMVACVRDGREFDNERWVEWLDREAELRARPVYRMRSDLFRVMDSSAAFKELVEARAKTFEEIVDQEIPRPAGAGVWSDHPNTAREDSTADEADTWAERDDVASWCGPHWERLRLLQNNNRLIVEISPQLAWNHPFGETHKLDPNHHNRADFRRALLRTPDGRLRTARRGEREAAFDDFVAHEVSWYKAKGAILPTPSSRADSRPVMFPLSYNSRTWFNRREGDIFKFVDNVGALEQHQESPQYSHVPDASLQQMYNPYHTPFSSGMPGMKKDAAVHRERVMAADLARWSYRV